MLRNIINWIIIPAIRFPEYVLQFNRFLLLKQSNYNKDGWINILSPAKI